MNTKENLALPDFGFRMEGAGDIVNFVKSPFCFRRPSQFDNFEEHTKIEIPEGQKPAGIWFIRDIDALTRSAFWDILGSPMFISRIRISALKDIAALIEDPRMNPGTCYIAIKFYDPAKTPNLHPNKSLITGLPVPDDLIEVWLGDRWIKKNEFGLLDLDDIIHRCEWGDYNAPTMEQSVGAVSNEPHITSQPLDENWWLPQENSDQSALRLAGAKKIVQLFRRAKNFLKFRELREEERRFTHAHKWHLEQVAHFAEQNDSDGERIHSAHARFRQADVQRFRHEQQLLLTGKTFWQIHDLNTWAAKALQLQRIDDPSLLFAQLPGDAIQQLVERMNEMRHDARKAHAEKYVLRMGLAAKTRSP